MLAPDSILTLNQFCMCNTNYDHFITSNHTMNTHNYLYVYYTVHKVCEYLNENQSSLNL